MKYIPSRRAGAALVVSAVAGGLLASSAASGAATLRVGSERQGVKFTKSRLSAPAGRVTIVLRVPRRSQFPHAIAIRGNGVNRSSAVVQRGTTRVSVRLRRGRYTFYCPVGEHAENGMRGRLRIR